MAAANKLLWPAFIVLNKADKQQRSTREYSKHLKMKLILVNVGII